MKVVETRADGSYVAEVGRFKVLLRREADVITTTLLDGIAAGTVLGQLRIDRPFTDALQVAAQRAEAVPATPLLTTVSTPEIASGSVAAGGRIISAGVAHALTGTLRADARAGWSSTPILTAGTPMFGVVMSATTGAYRDSDIVWCAPQRDEAGAVKSLCFAPGNRLVEANLPYVITGVSSSSAGKPAFPPVVSRGPVDFGAPLVLEVRYDSADKRWVRIGFSVAHADAPAWAQLPLRRSPDGGAILAFAGVLVELRPADDLRSVDVRLLGGTPSATAEALPTDAYELLQR